MYVSNFLCCHLNLSGNAGALCPLVVFSLRELTCIHAVCVWRCEHAKVLCGNVVCAIYIFILLSSFIHSGLASRCLQLVVHYIPRVQAHFEAALPAKNHSMLKHFDKIVKVGVPDKCAVVFIYKVDTNFDGKPWL